MPLNQSSPLVSLGSAYNLMRSTKVWLDTSSLVSSVYHLSGTRLYLRLHIYMRTEKRRKTDIAHLDNLDDTAEREGQGDNDEEAGEQSDQEGTKSWSLVAS